MSESLVRRLSRRFSRRGSKPRRRRDFSDGKCRDKDSIPCVVILLDGSTLSFNLAKKSIGMELISLVNKNLDLVEKAYFGLQFTDTLQVSHWLDPLKKVKKQVRSGSLYNFNFRVKFYAAEPHSLNEELTRYHFFLQLKQDILEKRLQVPLKKVVELAAYSLQSELGDYDSELHNPDYVSNFRFIPEQTTELEREIKRKHKLFAGLNPAECEVHFLKIIKSLELYGIVQYEVMGDKNRNRYHLGLSPKGIIVIKDNTQVATHAWPRITNMSFRRNRFNITVENLETPTLSESFSFSVSSAKASKQLWKAAVEYHSFFRLVKTGEQPATTLSFFRRGSRFRFSGRTQFQATKESEMSARKAMKFERTRSERYSKRSTVGYIRVGSRVWAKALNGDYYKGTVTGLGEKVHIKFNNDDTIAHERDTEDCVIFDMEPNPEDIQIGTRLIAHWPSLSAYLSGTVIKMEGQKYYVHYDDGDKGWNNIRQVRILKPPVYFGPGANYRAKVKKSESFKETSMTTRPITVEKPLKAKQVKRAMNNEHPISPDHVARGDQPQDKTNAGDNQRYNERKVSYSARKGNETRDSRANNGQASPPLSPTGKSSKLEQILNMSNVATNVDTGESVFVDDEEKHRYKQKSKRNYSADDEPSSFSGKRSHHGKNNASSNQQHYYASKSPGPPITEL